MSQIPALEDSAFWAVRGRINEVKEEDCLQVMALREMLEFKPLSPGDDCAA